LNATQHYIKFTQSC